MIAGKSCLINFHANILVFYKMEHVVITGGTGAVGSALTAYLLQKGYRITIFTRNPSQYKEDEFVKYAAWDPYAGKIDADILNAADHVVHLAGAGVMAQRWSPAYKREIRDSRTKSSQLIIKNIRTGTRVRSIVSASATGWYGPDGQVPFVESDPPATDFLGETCRVWEESIRLPAPPVKVCSLRTGIVLTKEEGAIGELAAPLRYGIAAIPGSGKQVMSWIHMQDLVRMYHFAMEKELTGVYNAVAPEPCSLKKMVTTLGREYKGAFFIPVHVPAFMVKIIKGEGAEEILKSTTISCMKIKNAGFTFLYPSIEPAIENL